MEYTPAGGTVKYNQEKAYAEAGRQQELQNAYQAGGQEATAKMILDQKVMQIAQANNVSPEDVMARAQQDPELANALGLPQAGLSGPPTIQTGLRA